VEFVVVGAGAIGGTVGARLLRDGHDVLFCDVDGEHVAAINEHGLTIEGPLEQFTVEARAVVPADLPAPLGAVLLAVKAQHTEAALAEVGPRLAPHPEPAPAGVRSVARFVWLRSGVAGWWDPAEAAGAEVGAGALLGTASDLYGDTIEEVRAPESGVLLFVTTSPAVQAQGLLLGLGAGVEPLQPG